MSERFREVSLPAARALAQPHGARARHAGEFAASLLVDAAAVAFVRIHGADPLAWARATPS